MNARTYQRVVVVFNDVRRRERDQRERRARELCGGDAFLLAEVESLLEFHEAVPDATDGAGAEFDGAPPIPSMIGAYRVVRPLGTGGMGRVFLAEQPDPHRLVAIKMIREGADDRRTAARFRFERQALALLDHPNVTGVFDAGATEDGQPYVVMEYVDGVPMTRYCAQHALDLDAVLAMFASVCDAVHAAHQKGVIHRDIKPGNVLVTRRGDRDVPKVIDFGIARPVRDPDPRESAGTLFGQLVGTPAYMSPEQIVSPADVDVRTDVYSLGVFLCELLTGTLPFPQTAEGNAGLLDLARHIQDERPARPSALARRDGKPEAPSRAARLRGDLDWIVLRCLEKDPARRYASAAALADDVRRHLRHEPVSAAPAGVAYRLNKLVRRRPVASAATVLVLAGALGMIVVMTILYRSALRSETLAMRGQHRAGEAFAFLSETYDTLGRDYLRDSSTTLRDTLQFARTLVDTRFPNDPDIRAEVRVMLSHAFQSQQMLRPAESLLREALVDLQPLDESADPLRAKVHVEFARLLVQMRRPQDALDEVAAVRTLAAGPGGAALALEASLAGAQAMAVSDPSGAVAALSRLIRQVRDSGADTGTLLPRALAERAELVGRDAARLDEADALWHEAQDAAAERLGPLEPEKFELTHRYAVWLLQHRRPAQAEALAARAVRDLEEQHAEHWFPQLHSLVMSYHWSLLAQGKVDQAIEDVLKHGAPTASGGMLSLAMLAMSRLDDPQLTERLARESIRYYLDDHPDYDTPPPVAAGVLAWSLVNQGQCAEARELLLAAHDRARANAAPGQLGGLLGVMLEYADKCNDEEMAASVRQEMEFAAPREPR